MLFNILGLGDVVQQKVMTLLDATQATRQNKR